MIIKGNEINDNTIMELGKFTVLWNMFEENFCSNNCNPSKIKEVASEILLNDEAIKEFADVLNKRRGLFQQEIIDYIKTGLYPNGAHQGKDEDNEMMQQFMKQNGEYINYGCLLAINRIRNNLLHGLKCVSELDNQIELFKAVNKILESISWRI